MRILGISAFYHDSAAAFVENGEIVAAAQEERFTRRKHDAAFPQNAIQYCLRHAGTDISSVDYVSFYDKPLLTFARLLQTYLAFAPRGFTSFNQALPKWLTEKLFQKKLLINKLKHEIPDFDWDTRLLFSEHHLSHAASAYFPSPFEDASVLTMDGVGEWATTSLAIGRGTDLAITKEIHFPHSVGLLYSAFTHHIGFKVNSGEYKVMGLAPYGEPRYAQTILDNLVDLKEDGSFRLNQSYFDYCTGLRMTNARFGELFGGPSRISEELITQKEMDLAASVQAVTEEIVLRLARSIANVGGSRNLCLAGGVALNCVANGKIAKDNHFDKIWIQPAAGDAGGALGAAMATYYGFLGQGRTLNGGRDSMKGSYLGPEFSDTEIERRLRECGARLATMNAADLVETVADALVVGNSVGWFQGRMEFGPRALGGRSILGDPRSPTMQRDLNLKIKNRESFRPFAPSVLREELCNWFDLDTDSPYMLVVANVKKEHRMVMTSTEQSLFGIEKLNVVRSSVPAITHVDYSARIQTVHADTNPRYHALISAFHKRTGCPILVNTSFNVRGEPIVCTPEDAFRCFMGTELELLAIGNCLLLKDDQDPSLRLDYKNSFALD